MTFTCEVISLAEGEVVYEVRADDSKVKKDLDDAEKKITQSSEQTSKAQKEDYKSTAKEFKKQSDNVVDDAKSANSKIEESSSNTSGAMQKIFEGAAINIGGSLVDMAKNAVSSIGELTVGSAINFDQAMNQFAASTGKGQAELGEYEETLKSIYTNNYGESFGDVADAMAAVTQQMGDLDQISLQHVTEGVFALSDVFESDFNETLRGVNQLMVQFGISSEDALDLLTIGSQLGLDYTDELGDNIAEYAGKFAQAGYSAEEYFQLLKNGTKNGAYNLDKVNDSINEVTTRLADGTISGAIGQFSTETQSLFEQWQNGGASQKQVIDSIVEDIANCTSEQEALTMAATAFGTMGEDANLDFIKSLSSVGEEFDNTKDKMEDLKNVKYDDLGSMFEGIKRQAETALLDVGNALMPIIAQILDTVGPMLSGLFDGIGPAVEGVTTQLAPLIDEMLPRMFEAFSQIMEPIGELAETLLPVFMEAWDTISEPLSNLVETILPPLSEILETVVGAIGQIASEIIPILAEGLAILIENITPIVDAILPILVEVINQLLPPIMELISNIMPVLLDLFQSIIEPVSQLAQTLMPILKDIIDALMPVIQSVIDVLSPLIELFSQLVGQIISAIMPAIQKLAEIFGTVLAKAIELISPILDGLMDVFGGLIDFISGVFSGNWEQAWNGIVDMFKGIFNLIPTIIESILNGAIWIINQLIGGINALTGAIGIPAIPTIPDVTLPRFHTGGIVDFAMGEGPALLKDGEMVLTQKQQAELFALANGNYSDAANSSVIVVNSPLYLDGKLITDNVTKHQYNDVMAKRYKG